MTIYTFIMGISLVVITFMLIIIAKQKTKNQMQQIFLVNIILLFILCLSIFLQSILSDKLNIDPIFFEYFAYIGGCYIPVSIFMTSLIFVNTKITFKKEHLLLLILPTLTLFVLWTNNIHHLFFEKYSIYMKEGILGPFAYVYTYYSYLMLFLSFVLFSRGVMKNSGFFSTQGILIILGVLFPVVINMLGTFGIIDITVYVTPISFVIAMLFFAIAIFKFDFLSVNPIALQKIVNKISDSYIVINDDNIITDYNETFIKTFDLSKYIIRNIHIKRLLDATLLSDTDKNIFLNKILEAKKTHFECKYTTYFDNLNKYFNIEINTIENKKNILGVLILFKDVTQHMEDMKIIKSNQEILVEQERLASLGQMIGGIAHNMKTPIMSIGGATEGISDLIKEYQLSIKDPEVTIEDHEQIANEMNEWIKKIKSHLSYMSDIITAVKGQAVTLSRSNEEYFSIEELIKRIDILMKHELKNAIIYLKITNNVDPKFELKGNINGLVQVINNIISNAIQAYNGKTNENIELVFNKSDNKIIIEITDYAGGIPKSVQNKLFNSMITTKGKNGTGLGLFMSYSNIKAHFGGNITFKSKQNVGTTFYITIPIK